MEKLYTEKQYNKFSEYMDLIGKEIELDVDAMYHEDLHDWIEEEKIADLGIDQMYERYKKEVLGEIPKLRLIK